MNPPSDINPAILKSITSISEKIGTINTNYHNKSSPKLRKENKIKTIHSSLRIEGNTLTLYQMTALLENKRIIGPKKDVKDVLNAIGVYERLEDYDPLSETFLECHKNLMNSLVENAGKYRKQGVGIMKSSKVEHFAPPHHNVPFLIKASLLFKIEQNSSHFFK